MDAPATPAARARQAAARTALHAVLAIALACVALGPLLCPQPAPEPPLPLCVDLARDPPERLAWLPGVGPRLAQALATHRASHGAPRTLAQLAAVPGMGPARAAALLATRTVRLRSDGLPLGDPGTRPATGAR